MDARLNKRPNCAFPGAHTPKQHYGPSSAIIAAIDVLQALNVGEWRFRADMCLSVLSASSALQARGRVWTFLANAHSVRAGRY